MPNPYEELVKQETKKAAEKICDLTGYGQSLHPNDILPEIRDAVNAVILSRLQRLIEEVEKMKKKTDDFKRSEEPRDVLAAWAMKIGYNEALSDIISLLTAEQEQIKKLL